MQVLFVESNEHTFFFASAAGKTESMNTIHNDSNEIAIKTHPDTVPVRAQIATTAMARLSAAERESCEQTDGCRRSMNCC